MPQSPSSPTTILGYIDSVYPAFALLAGMQLDLFTPLSERPYSAPQLAQQLQVDEDRLQRLLLALVQANLLTWDGDCFATTTETAVYLNRHHPQYMNGLADFFTYVWQDVVPHTADSIRQGRPQAQHDFSQMSDEEIGRFLQILHPEALSTGRYLAQQPDFSHYRSILDVAGGTGGVAIALAQACPDLHTAVVELPTIVPHTTRFIADAHMRERVQIISADFLVDEIPGQYDAIIMKAFTHILAAESTALACRKAFNLLSSGGTLYIKAAILDDGHLSPAWVVQFDVVLLNLYVNGRAYTERKYRHWLEEAGFVDITRPDPSFMIARKR
jgi:predicted O-methyltransferase YrrM